jgi:hypothetical protein
MAQPKGHKMAHKIGAKVWHSGDEVTIISNSYVLHGGEFQDAITETGKTITIATPEQQSRNAERSRTEWIEQQSQFRKLI